MLWFSACLISAQAQENLPLPVDKAFVFSAHMEQSTTLIVEWQLAPGYFLYKDKLHIFATPSQPTPLGVLTWPATKTIYLEARTGAVPTAYKGYQGKFRVVIPLLGRAQDALKITVKYQGCSQDGYCYAPIQKILYLRYPFVKEGLRKAPLLTIQEEGSAMEEEHSLFTDQEAAKAFVSSHHILVTLLCFLGLGLLLAFTPCSLPMIPILSSIIVGHKKATTRRAFYLSLSYVFGIALTYAVAGIVIAWLGSGVQAYFQNPWIITLFSLIFIFLAVALLGGFELRFPRTWQKKILGFQQRQRGGNYLGVFLMGCFSTLIVSPCVTAPLVGVLAYVSETGNVLLGGLALFALGFGMGLPLLVIGFSAGKYLPRSGPWMTVIEKLFAFLLLGLAIWMLSRILPAGFTLFLWACLLLITAVYLFFVGEVFSKAWRYFARFLGIFLAVYGFVLFVGVAMSYTSPFYPFEKVQAFIHPQAFQKTDFIVVQDMAHLSALLEQAAAEKRPVLLDFYADWCESCRTMEKAVLGAPSVKAELQHFMLLRADVTANNEFDQDLLKRYHVVAPPTFLFFNREGQELMEKRIVGEVKLQVFLARARNI